MSKLPDLLRAEIATAIRDWAQRQACGDLKAGDTAHITAVNPVTEPEAAAQTSAAARVEG